MPITWKHDTFYGNKILNRHYQVSLGTRIFHLEKRIKSIDKTWGVARIPVRGRIPEKNFRPLSIPALPVRCVDRAPRDDMVSGRTANGERER